MTNLWWTLPDKDQYLHIGKNKYTAFCGAPLILRRREDDESPMQICVKCEERAERLEKPD